MGQDLTEGGRNRIRQSGVVNPPARRYRERLVAPLGWWLAVIVFGVMVGWVFFVAATPTIAVVAGCAAAVLAAIVVGRYGSMLIIASAEGLRAGEAFLDDPHIGDVTPLDAAGWRRALSAQDNRHAFTVLRPYIRTGVRIDVDDPNDPTPCWLVATRSPAAVARALGRAG